MANYANTLFNSINTVLLSLNSLHASEVLGKALAALGTGITCILTTNNHIIQNLVDASRGGVTSSLFPFHYLRKLLHAGKHNYKFTPLFNLKTLHHYYPLLKSKITLDAIIIYVLFKSEHLFDVYRMEPFPFLVNGSTITLVFPASVVLLSQIHPKMPSKVLQTYRLPKQTVSQCSFVRLLCLSSYRCLMMFLKLR